MEETSSSDMGSSDPVPTWDILVVGGGAAGFFAAITAAEAAPEMRIGILERGNSVLQKVLVSGGGRCNVTHASFEPEKLIAHYPRGSRELLGPFIRFGPTETIEWFRNHGVVLKTERDGRMFPVTDNSETIAQCLLQSAKKAGVQLITGSRLEDMQSPNNPGEFWKLLVNGKWMQTKQVMIATGSSTAVWKLLNKLDLALVAPVPSLFTFNIRDPRLEGLAGISLPNVTVQVEGNASLQAQGPLLITHWGISGPAVLRLSAWGARWMSEQAYKFIIRIQWMPIDRESFTGWILDKRSGSSRKLVVNSAPEHVPQRLWERLVKAAGLPVNRAWAELRKAEERELANQCLDACYQVSGKSTFKEEFVTAGGVDLKEIDFKSFEVRRYPGLYMAGEVLNIDAITGGFNFQAAWTGGQLAGKAMASRHSENSSKVRT